MTILSTSVAGRLTPSPPVPKLEVAKPLPADLVVVELPTRSLQSSPILVDQIQQAEMEDINMDNEDGTAPQSNDPAPLSPEKKPSVKAIDEVTGATKQRGSAEDLRAASSSVIQGTGATFGTGEHEEGVKLEDPNMVDGVATDDQPSESGEETLVSTQPSRKKRKRSGTEMLDVTMLDSGPSSRFVSPSADISTSQSPVITTQPLEDDKIFRGLSIFVDLATKNRSDRLKEIKVCPLSFHIQDQDQVKKE